MTTSAMARRFRADTDVTRKGRRLLNATANESTASGMYNGSYPDSESSSGLDQPARNATSARTVIGNATSGNATSARTAINGTRALPTAIGSPSSSMTATATAVAGTAVMTALRAASSTANAAAAQITQTAPEDNPTQVAVTGALAVVAVVTIASAVAYGASRLWKRCSRPAATAEEKAPLVVARPGP